MTHLGTVISYDRGRRAGMLRPDQGGEAVVFKSADQPEFFPDPRPFQRYSFGLLVAVDGGQPRAINLRRQLSHREQAEAQAG